MELRAQSKGRTPSVFVFNPLAEGYIAYGRAFTPIKHQEQLATDLANLPQFLARQDDVVLTTARPSVEFLSGLKQADFPLPEFVELDRVESLAGRDLGRLRPWAWGPDSVELLRPLFAGVRGGSFSPERHYNEGIVRLYSKAWSAALLKSLLQDWSEEEWLCTAEEVGVPVKGLEEAEEVIAAIRRRGRQRVLAKAALGLAGRNSIRLWEPELLESQRRWLARALQHGRQVVIEPWLERIADFSVQLEMEPAGLKLCGYTLLQNDPKGQYLGNSVFAPQAQTIPAGVLDLFKEPADISARLQRLFSDIFARLGTELRRLDFEGPLGIDAFVYRTATGQHRLKPIVELNPRYTMGRLTLELLNYIRPESHVVFRLINLTQARREGFASLWDWARSFQAQFPLRLGGEPGPRICSGAICLNDPARAQVCVATLQVLQKPPRGAV